MRAFEQRIGVFSAIAETIRRFLHRRERRPFFAGKFFSNGTKIIQTARNMPRRRQKIKPRRQIVMARRQKVRRAISLSVKLLLVGAGIVALAINLAHFLRSSSRFAISHIGVSGNTNVTGQSIIRQSGLIEGRNIFQVNLRQSAAAIEQLPRVKSALVRTKLPDEIQIDISEREPAAVLAAKELFLLDSEGKIIEKLDPSENLDAPVITGRALAGLAVGDVVKTEGVARALEIIRILNEMDVGKSIRVSEINVDDPANILLVAEPSGATVYLGSGDYRGKLWRLAQVADEINRNDRLHPASLERIDMRFESIVPAKFSDS